MCIYPSIFSFCLRGVYMYDSVLELETKNAMWMQPNKWLAMRSCVIKVHREIWSLSMIRILETWSTLLSSIFNHSLNLIIICGNSTLRWQLLTCLENCTAGYRFTIYKVEIHTIPNIPLWSVLLEFKIKAVLRTTFLALLAN